MDGGRIRMKLHVGGEFELVSWILSFGPSAQVILPDRLRERVQSELSRALDKYTKEITVAPPKKPRKIEARKAAARH
jgi:predicted DNA-binding transcriptional regulator YafY